jgi:hypothetical protein
MPDGFIDIPRAITRGFSRRCAQCIQFVHSSRISYTHAALLIHLHRGISSRDVRSTSPCDDKPALHVTISRMDSPTTLEGICLGLSTHIPYFVYIFLGCGLLLIYLRQMLFIVWIVSDSFTDTTVLHVTDRISNGKSIKISHLRLGRSGYI